MNAMQLHPTSDECYWDVFGWSMLGWCLLICLCCMKRYRQRASSEIDSVGQHHRCVLTTQRHGFRRFVTVHKAAMLYRSAQIVERWCALARIDAYVWISPLLAIRWIHAFAISFFSIRLRVTLHSLSFGDTGPGRKPLWTCHVEEACSSPSYFLLFGQISRLASPLTYWVPPRLRADLP